MTINIQNASNVTVNGTHNRRNCKAVYNITTGEMYASVLDAANALGVSQGSVSAAICDDKNRTCKGMRLCFVSKMMEYLDEINEQNRIRTAKVVAYDADVERRNAIANAQDKIEQHERNIRLLNKKLQEETDELEAAKVKLSRLKNVEV